jgi:hypothetical protein
MNNRTRLDRADVLSAVWQSTIEHRGSWNDDAETTNRGDPSLEETTQWEGA